MKAIKKNGYVLITMIFFVISLSVLVLFLTLFKQSTQVDATTVGNVYIGDTENEVERRSKLSGNVNTWKTTLAIYKISFQGIEVQIGSSEKIGDDGKVVTNEAGEVMYERHGLDFLEFDYDSTISHLVVGKENLVYYKINAEKKQAFYDVLVEKYSEYLCSDLDFDRLIADIEKKAQEMTSIADFSLYDYLKSYKSTLVTSIPLSNLSEQTIDKIVEIFEEEQIEILPIDDTKNKLGFSAIDFFSDEKFSELSSSDMSIIATGIAAVSQETSFTVTVKNQGFETDRDYAYKHMTARVNPKDGTDLRVINPEDSSYFIQITKEGEGEDLQLKFSLYGCVFVNKYEIFTEETRIAPYINYNVQENNFAKENATGVDDVKGCYYITISAGTDTILYSTMKRIIHVDGSIEIVEVYPKQEYYKGDDEIRWWCDNEYVAPQD